MTSSPFFIPFDAETTPGTIRLELFWIGATAPSSATTTPLVATSWSILAAETLRMIFHPNPMSYRAVATTVPSTMISSIRSNPGTLFRSTILPSGRSAFPHAGPKSRSARERMKSISWAKAGLTSPGGVMLTGSVLPWQLPHSVDSRTGTLHCLHQRR